MGHPFYQVKCKRVEKSYIVVFDCNKKLNTNLIQKRHKSNIFWLSFRFKITSKIFDLKILTSTSVSVVSKTIESMEVDVEFVVVDSLTVGVSISLKGLTVVVWGEMERTVVKKIIYFT